MEKQNSNSNSAFGLFAGVFLLSSAILSFEILASRISAIVLVHNYAFMAVSLAVLGLGCGGIFAFYRWRAGKLDGLHREFSLYSSLFAVSVSLFMVLVTRVGFMASRFPYFLILFIPFFFAGVVLSLAFRSFAHESFKLYAADLIGAALGSISAIWILRFLGGVNGVLFIGILGSIASFSFSAGRRGRLSSLKTPALLSSLCVLLFLTNILTSFLGEVPIGRHPGKDLHNILSNPLLNAEMVESRWNTFGRTDLMRYKDNENVMLLFIDGTAGTARHSVMHALGFDVPLSSYIPHIEQQTALHEMEAGEAHEISMFNQIMVALSEGIIKPSELIAAMPYNVSPATDDKPFFFKAETGLPDEISSLLWLIILVNALVIAVPAIYKRVRGNLLRALALLMLLGAGFMMIEISFSQRLTLYLGSSTISLAVLLSSLLVGMGIGSLLGGKVYPNSNIRRLKMASSGVFIIAIFLFFVHPLILNNLLGSSILIKGIASAALLVPLGFILGIPFPTAINWLKEIDAEDSIAWLYGVNGTMSVLGSVAGIAVFLTFGFSVALILGALCYLAIVFMYF